MKKKMKFPDGSVREIDDADVATARSLGAVDFTEPAPAQKNGKKVLMQFSNGQTKEVDSVDVAVAESLGAVKKKETSEIGAPTTLPAGVSPYGVTQGSLSVTDVSRAPQAQALVDLDVQTLNKVRDRKLSSYVGAGFENLNLNDDKSISAAISVLDKPFKYERDEKGVTTQPDKELEKSKADASMLLKQRLMFNKSKQDLDNDVKIIEPSIKKAVTSANMRRERGENIPTEKLFGEGVDVDAQAADHFAAGLNYLKDANPAKFNNITRALAEKEQVADTDFEQVAEIGKLIRQYQGQETDANYMGSSYQSKKADYARQIGEWLKKEGVKGGEFADVSIDRAAKALGLNNKEILQDLKFEEKLIGYDAIPKSGGVEAFVRGVATPISGITNSLERWFNESDSDTYLKSQAFDVGIAQKVTDEKGQPTGELPSERGNIWYDALEGFGQFIPQVLLTRGIGGVAARGVGAAIPSAVSTASKANNLVNVLGTLPSVYLQEYGTAYQDALNKTGNPNEARAMGFINAAAASGFELFMPDAKIAQKAAGIFKGKYADDLIDLIRKGGDISDLTAKGRNLLGKFVVEVGAITGQEVKEEVATNLTNYLTETIFSPETAKERDLGSELLETAKATAIQMSIPALLGGGGSINRDFVKNGLHAAAINIDEYKKSLNRALIEGQITDAENNDAIRILETHRRNIHTSPELNINDKPIPQDKRMEFAFQQTNIDILNKKAESVTSDVQKEAIENKIKKAQDIQREIIGTEVTEEREGDTLKVEVEDTTQPSPLFNRVQEVLATPKNETPTEAKRVEFVKTQTEDVLLPEIKAQSLDVPTGALNTLNGDRELTTDLIADNSIEDINAAITKWRDQLNNIDEEGSTEEAVADITKKVRANLSLLQEGKKKKEAAPAAQKVAPQDVSGEVVIEKQAGQDVSGKSGEEIKMVEDKISKGEDVSEKDIIGLSGEEIDSKTRFTEEENKIISQHNSNINELNRLKDVVVKRITNGEEVDESDGKRIAELNEKIKKQEKSLPQGTVRGKIRDGIPSFSDMVSFEYNEDINKWKGKLVDIGGTVYSVSKDGKMKAIPFVELNTKTGKYEATEKPDRAIKYGNTVPKQGEFIVTHGSPSGRIEKFDESKFGKGFQREELPHERFEGVYADDNTYFNKNLGGLGYGEVHEYSMSFENSISEPKAEKLLREHEKEIDKSLSRKEASQYIKSLGYDMIYRSNGDGTYTYVGLDVNKIKPQQQAPKEQLPASTETKSEVATAEKSKAEKVSKIRGLIVPEEPAEEITAAAKPASVPPKEEPKKSEPKPKKEKPAKEVARKIRDEKARKEIDGLWDEFMKGDNLLTSGGLDPKKIEIGTKLVGAYIKQGVYKFADILEDAYAKFGDKLEDFVDALKSVYSTYYNTQATNEEAELMDASVRNITLASVINRIEDGKPAHQAEEVPAAIDRSNTRQFVDVVKEKLRQGEKMGIVALRKIAADKGIVAKDTEIQEMTELAIVELAREISNSDQTVKNRFDGVVDLYNSQPTISMRSSERIDKQQYSTPIPISFLMGDFVNKNTTEIILEPNAGNGMLTIAVPPSKVIANEIDPVRLQMLAEQGFGQVTNQDATKPFPGQYGGIIMNPPFGSKAAVKFDGVEIKGLDEQMVANALQSLHPNGRAAIMIGGHNKYDEKGRLAADRVFLNYLYNRYNVSDIINIDGSLWSKQGTTFPTRVILIDGVKSEKSGVAPVEDKVLNKPVTSFDELFTRIQNAKQNGNTNKATGVQSQLDANANTGNVVPGGVISPGQEQTTTPEPSTNQDKLLNTTKSESERETPSDDRGPAANISGVSDTGIRQPDQSDITDRGVAESEGQVSERQQPAVSQPGRSAEDIQRNEPVSISDRAGSILSDKVKYRPKSKSGGLDTVIPTQMATETDHTLDAIEDIYGDIDAFVAKELEYKDKQAMYKALSAEQVDAVAIAIHQLKSGQGMIIGDMTGVGKGRIAAAVIRYGVINGFKPIFLTEKPNLFSDNYRDMVAIGSGKLVPFIVNDQNPDNDPNIKDQNGVVVHKSFGGNRKKIILNAGVIPKDFDYTVATYSQFRTALDKPSLKRDFFLNNTQGNIVIMDESHNASGDSNAGELFQNTLPNASGVIFLSATFAKRPNNMPVYAMKTAMADANMSKEELVAAIEKGGVALQEVVSANLVQSGQMLRRERDFTGVKVDYNVLEEFKNDHRRSADGITSAVRDIIKFEDRYVRPVLADIDSELVAQQSTAEKRKGTKKVGVDNQPFVSKTFNLINQLLFSIKAKQIAQAAIKAHKEGKKPVIGFLSTMESFLNSMGIATGEKLDKADFALVLKRGLEGTMKYTIKNPEGENIPKSLSVSDLTPEGQKQYKKLLDDIRSIASGIHISPIDVMIKELKDAGLRVGEITGRNRYLEIQDDGSSIVKDRQERDINTIARKFNNGELDVILLNASGATGISLHASQDFKDQRPRVLISGQLELDINKEVQKRGRIDRTGQVHRGEFQYVVSSIPAEQRLLMMFKAKLKSLDANTTSSQKSKSNQLETIDFLNKYGDEIVTQYVKENSDFNQKILDPFDFASMSEEDLADQKKIDKAASRVTGRVAILPTREQEQFYSEIIEAYKSYITHLNDNNENDLEVNLLPLNAKTLERTEVIAGRGTDSPFGMASIREKVEVDVLTKPMKREEIEAEVEKYLDGRTRNEIRDGMLKELSAYEETFIENKTTEIETHYNDEVIPETIARLEKKKDVTAEELEAKRNELEEAKDKRIERERLKYQNIFGRVENSMRTFTPGAVYKVPVSSRIDTNTFFSNGVFLGFKIKEGAVNKYTPSNIVIKFAVNDGRRVVNVPLSKTEYVDAIIANSRYGTDSGNILKDWDSKISNKTRATRYIITGNLLQAYGTNDGQLASFTTEGGAIRKGMILPDSYEAGKQKFRTTMSRAFTDNVNRVISSDGDVIVERDRGGYLISVPLSKQRGGKYFLDETLRSFVAGGGFDQRGTKMVGMVNEDNIRPLLLALDAMGVTSETETAPRAESKSLGDTIRDAKIRLGGLQSNIAGIPIALYNAAIETIALAVDAGMTITQAIKKAIADHKLDKQKNFNRKEFIRAVEDASGEVFDENEGVTPKEIITQDDKSILNRMVKSNKVSDEVKEKLKASGLKYKIRTQKEARAAANGVIDEFGIDAAVGMAEGGRFHGDVNSMIFAVSLDKVFAEEQSAATPEDRQAAAERWAGIAIRYQDAAESGGRFISAINDFYKKSPAGLVIKIEKEFQRRQDEYFEGREKPTKEAWEEFINTVEGKELLEEELAKRQKQGRKIFSPESEKKIKSFFAKLRVDTKGTAGSYLLPPQLYNKAIDIIEGAVLGGLSIGKAIDQALDYINDNFKGTWQVKEFKKDIRDGFKNQNVQKVLSESDKEKILKKWERKLGGLNADERNSLLNKAFLELAENGALEYDDFKQMYAEAAGLPQMTPELQRQLIDLANKINEPDKIKEAILNTKDPALIKAYEKAIIDAEKAATTLNELIGKQKWWVNTFLTVMRLNTLGMVSLVGNIAYNVAALPVRFATNLTATGLDYLLAGAQLTSDKIFGTSLYKNPPPHNVFTVQGGFARGLWLGTKTAAKQFFTGLTNRDYFQREIRQNIKPLTSAKRLIRAMTGKEKLSLNETLNSIIEAFPTMGMSAEVIARALNVGDKPFRYAAEFAAAERLAQQKGLKGIDKEIFILFPDEESEKKIKDQGEKIVFQQKNVVTKMLDAAGNTVSNFVNELGWETKTLHGIGKTLGYATQPFLNTPLNVFSEFIHYAFPPLALYKAGKAMVKGDAEAATYHLAQAVTGMSIAYAAGTLAANGLIAAAGGDDDEAKERRGIQTYQRQGQLNVSGLKRWLAGEPPTNEDGDIWIDLKYYGFVGMMMLAKAKQYKGKTKEQIEMDTYVQDMVGQFIPSVKIGLTEGVFSGTSSLINALSMGGGYVDNWALGMGNVVVNAFEPQWLRQISLASNEYYRDPKGMTLPETAKNQLKQRFFMGDQLPARVNIWGDKVESVPNNTNPYLYNVLGLNKAAVFDNDRFGFVLYDYYNKTKDYNIFPPALKREVNEKSLTPQQYEEFSILVGSHRKQLVAPFIENGSFQEISSSTEEGAHAKLIKELSKIYDEGRELAVKEFVSIYPEFQKVKKGGDNAVQE